MKENENKPICEIDYGDNVFLLVQRVSRALTRAGQREKAEEWKREYRKKNNYEEVWDLAEKYVEMT
ncbi:MAG: hypothetical protein K2O02_06800 [Lachnospiraceae bacterium]|nr:hypothetical protein [Lachnospiraceae bacterium]